jgi:hypothetical protein
MYKISGKLPQEPMPQVGLLGAQEPPEEPEEPVLNMDKIRRGFNAPHLGHFNSVSLSFMLRRSSNFSSQLWHSYS